MKMTFKAEYLKFLTLGAGVLGLVLRIALYAAGIDGRGLLVENHWTRIGITVLTVMTGLILALRCLRISGPRRYRSSYPASAAAALGCAVCGTAVLITGISEFSPDDRTSILASLAAFAAGISLLTLTFFRLRGNPRRCPDPASSRRWFRPREELRACIGHWHKAHERADQDPTLCRLVCWSSPPRSHWCRQALRPA